MRNAITNTMNYSEFITELKALDFYIENLSTGLKFKKHSGYCETTYYANKIQGNVYLDYPAGKIHFDNYSESLEFINGNKNLGKRSSSNYNRY